GLQVIENIDSSLFRVYPIYIATTGEFFHLPKISNRSDFLTTQKIPITFGHDGNGGFFQSSGFLGGKVYLDAAYLAFHGGDGESGPLEGLFESCAIAHTGHSVFTSSVSMNKQITKDLVSVFG